MRVLDDAEDVIRDASVRRVIIFARDESRACLAARALRESPVRVVVVVVATRLRYVRDNMQDVLDTYDSSRPPTAHTMTVNLERWIMSIDSIVRQAAPTSTSDSVEKLDSNDE